MALPFSRERTYNDDTPVDPNDLNAIQDSIAAEHNRSIHLSPAKFWATPATLDQIAMDESGAFWRGTPAGGSTRIGIIDITERLIPGDTIKEFVARWQNGATPTAGTFDIAIIRTPIATMVRATLASTAENTNTGGADVRRSKTVAVGHTVLADNYYAIEFEMNATAGDDQAGFGGVSVVLEDP